MLALALRSKCFKIRFKHVCTRAKSTQLQHYHGVRALSRPPTPRVEQAFAVFPSKCLLPLPCFYVFARVSMQEKSISVVEMSRPDDCNASKGFQNQVDLRRLGLRRRLLVLIRSGPRLLSLSLVSGPATRLLLKGLGLRIWGSGFGVAGLRWRICG